jgi:hypothetical protein
VGQPTSLRKHDKDGGDDERTNKGGQKDDGDGGDDENKGGTKRLAMVSTRKQKRKKMTGMLSATEKRGKR